MNAFVSWNVAAARLTRAAALALALSSATNVALAQRDLKDIPSPDPELERATFEVAEGFEVNLYAADPLLAKPIQINFDDAGRMWVASSSVYPQIKPGQEATDKVVVLEDVDHDGKADKTTVFADGLLIPTGVEAGFGGAFVANSTELVHFEDVDGDGKADKKRVVLSGFGTEDTHHIIHTFRWGPDGAMYFNQSIYIHSHVETPWGVRRLGGGGIWRWRPDDLRMDILCKGMVNSWGHDFDDYGQSWATDGAGFQGIHWITPGATYFAFPNTKREAAGLQMGHPKYCGLEIVGGSHLPDDWQGDLITNDFRAHRVCRFKVADEGAGFTATQMPDVIRSNHVAFRPIDVKLGPDGAIYIADWYNPIIQHGEVDFRDPRRDLVHGRIWRVSAKGRKPIAPPNLTAKNDAELVNEFTSPDPWTRRFARRVLVERSSKPAWVAPESVSGEPVAERRVNTIEISDVITDGQRRKFETNAARDKFRLEMLWLAQSIQKGPFGSDVIDLVRDLLQSETPQIRAAAVRAMSLELGQFPDALSLLGGLVNDSYPRVRLEAIRALGQIPKVEAMQAALQVLDHPMDKFLNYALLLTVDELEAQWSPALQSGELKIEDPSKLEFLVTAAPSSGVVSALVKLTADKKLAADRRVRLLTALASVGGPKELALVFDEAVDAAEGKSPDAAKLLDALAQATRRRKVEPAGEALDQFKMMAPLMKEPADTAGLAAAFRLFGAWKTPKADAVLTQAAERAVDPNSPVAIAAMDGLAEFGGPTAVTALTRLAKEGDKARRARATAALATIDLGAAAQAAAAILSEAKPEEYDAGALIATLVRTKDGPATLAKALEGKSIPSDVAKVATRLASSAGEPGKPLEAALRAAGKLDAPRALPTPAEVAELVAQAKASGDAVRGEAVFRRKNLQCLQCHAVGGAGGRVGPDLTTIGSSAQPDYLVDSLLDPNKQVKENYNAIICETTDGRVITGLKVRQNDQELIIRNAEDKDVTIAAGDIDTVTVGKSLMPVGLLDPLTRDELLDLVRFLSELGKPGPFGPAPSPVIRRWRVLEPTQEARTVAREAPSYAEAANDPRLTWSAAYSTVDGALPIAEFPTAGPWYDTKQFAWYQADVDVETAGAIAVKLNSPEALRIFIDGQPTDAAKLSSVDLTKGRHVLTFAVDRSVRQEPLRVEVAAAEGSSARVTPVAGK